MARVTLVVAFIAIAILALANIALQSEPPRHVDPSNLQWRPPAGLDMFYLYAALLTSIVNLDFEKARGNLSLIKEISIPENLRYVALRVNSLLEDITRSLNETRSSIDVAWSYFNRSSFNEAWDWLGRAERSLREARVSYLVLRDVASQVSMLGIPVGRFMGELGRIENVMDRLGEEIEVLRGALTRASLVTGTRVTLWVNTTRVQVGDWVKVEGLLLDAGGAPLRDRSVLVHFGSRVLKALTNDDGFFEVTLRVQEYRRYIIVYAEFTPVGDDRFKYAYSRSEDVMVEVFYVTPKLSIALSKTEALPLDNVTLTIESEPFTCARIKSPLVNKVLCTDSSGVASLSFTVDPMVADGVYNITVYVEPKGVIGPASGSVQLKVYRLNPEVSVKTPRWLIAGIPGELSASVSVESELQLCIEGLMCSGGRGLNLGFRVGVPVTYAGDSVRVVLVVEPVDPRFKATSLTLNVKVYNPVAVASLIALVALAIAIPFTLATRVAMSRQAPREVMVEEIVEARRAGGAVGELALLLGELSELTSRLYGVGLRASDTLREYISRLSSVAPKSLVDVLAGALGKLERILYGKPGTLRVEEVLELLKRIVESLRR